MARTPPKLTQPTTVLVSKVTVGTTPTTIVATSATRYVALVQVVSGGPVALSSRVPSLTDLDIETGEVFEHVGSLALNGVVASGTADVRVWEEFA